MSSSLSSANSSSQTKKPRYSDYYDLDDIIFSEVAVPVTVSKDLHGLGNLDPSSEEGEDLKAGTKLNLPLWIVAPLAKRQVVSIRMPKTHAKAIRQSLRADAAVLSMAQNPYIYELGSFLIEMSGDTELAPLLSSTFTARFAQLWDTARNWTKEDTSSATESMCNSEKRLFKKGYDSISDYHKWNHHREDGISAAPVIQIIARNRKRARPATLI